MEREWYDYFGDPAQKWWSSAGPDTLVPPLAHCGNKLYHSSPLGDPTTSWARTSRLRLKASAPHFKQYCLAFAALVPLGSTDIWLSHSLIFLALLNTYFSFDVETVHPSALPTKPIVRPIISLCCTNSHKAATLKCYSSFIRLLLRRTITDISPIPSDPSCLSPTTAGPGGAMILRASKCLPSFDAGRSRPRLWIVRIDVFQEVGADKSPIDSLGEVCCT